MGSNKITGLADGTASADAVSVSQMNTAIASASVPASTGAVLVSANDTTAQYLNGALVAGSGVTITENNDGADETLTVAADTTVMATLASVTTTVTTTVATSAAQTFARSIAIAN